MYVFFSTFRITVISLQKPPMLLGTIPLRERRNANSGARRDNIMLKQPHARNRRRCRRTRF